MKVITTYLYLAHRSASNLTMADMQDILLSDFFSQTYDQILSCLTQMCDGNCTTGGHNNFVQSESDYTYDKEYARAEQEDAQAKVETRRDVYILSYGIGNFISCLIARYQLAFLLALRDRLGAECTACEVFDPVFTSHERSVLKTFNCVLSSQNEEGKRLCSVRTIAFLPHCGKALYNNLLWRNAASPNCDSLFNLLLIGNSFQHMVERTPSRQLQKTANFVQQLQPYIREIQVDNNFTHKDIFNDLAIHWFHPSQQGVLVSCLERNCEEPVYDNCDVEFIRSKD
ncbi:srr1-like protein [Plakobranchus ocellatus]|uniref:Srr1-like protein n=1 Tax=Plakobranchus ocellatus TaxID=259542 RepID=A0AAV4D3T6_9GAST|nr:srr1-like protein [Plakobranchus ocellatus]